MSERWPALMTRETAAEYCDLSADAFDRQCPVAPVDQGWRGLRWKKARLDAWIEALPEKPRGRRSAALDGPPTPPANDAPETAPTADERRKRALERM